MQKLYFSLSFLLLLVNFQLLGNIDSLRIELRLATTDTLKISLLTAMGDKYESSVPDSAFHYYYKGLEIASASTLDHITLYQQKGQLLRYIGILYRGQGDYLRALEYYSQALEIFTQHGITKGISSTLNNFGVVHRNLGNYQKAVEYYLKALVIFEETGDNRGAASCYNNLGIIYDVQKDYSKALEYYQLAYDEFVKEDNHLILANPLINIANVYYALENFDMALNHYQRGLDILADQPHSSVKVRILHNIAAIYIIQKRHEEAYRQLEYALPIAYELNDLKSATTIILNKAQVRNNQGNYAEGMRFGLEALQLAEQTNALDDQTKSYKYLITSAARSGNKSLAFDYSQKYIALNDSLHSTEKSSIIFELEARYQNEKKQKEIELLHQSQEVQRLQLIGNQVEMQRQRFIILVVVFLMAMATLFFYLKTKELKIIRLNNKQLEIQNHEIQRKNKEIRNQRNEIHNQRNLVLDQKNLIQEQNTVLSQMNKEIISGIRYAERIQSSLFPDHAYLNKHLGESFVIFKPKDIISGDFYWLLPKNDKILIAAADCTGHGVAGSLLSMLGIAFLNESLHNPTLETSAHYLDYLTSRFDESLLVSEEGRQTREGMEISFCIYDTKESTIEFSGADSSIALVRNNKLNTIKGDRQAIGQNSSVKKGFSSKQVKLMAGDMIYIFSDGFINQFGGPNGNRYTTTGFSKLLENVSQHNLIYQKSLLESELDRWKGNNFEQVDDILILGFRV